jgi:hypothetical protein
MTGDFSATVAAMGAYAARLAMAAIFATAALHAMRDWDRYAAVVQAYRIVPEAGGLFAARLLPPLQLCVAIALLLPASAYFGIVAGCGLMSMFTAAISINLRRGRTHIDCGCGGGDSQKISSALVLRNLVLLALLACASMPGIGLDAASTVGVAGMAAFLIALYFAANQLMINAQVFAAHAEHAR